MGASLTLDSADGSREERVVLMDAVWAGPRPDTIVLPQGFLACGRGNVTHSQEWSSLIRCELPILRFALIYTDKERL